MKFCPRGLSGEDETASIYLFSEAGSELKGGLWWKVQKAASDEYYEKHGITRLFMDPNGLVGHR